MVFQAIRLKEGYGPSSRLLRHPHRAHTDHGWFRSGKGPYEDDEAFSFGVNPELVSALRESSLQIVGSDSEGELRVVEIPERSHPLIDGFLRAVDERRT